MRAWRRVPRMEMTQAVAVAAAVIAGVAAAGLLRARYRRLVARFHRAKAAKAARLRAMLAAPAEWIGMPLARLREALGPEDSCASMDFGLGVHAWTANGTCVRAWVRNEVCEALDAGRQERRTGGAARADDASATAAPAASQRGFRESLRVSPLSIIGTVAGVVLGALVIQCWPELFLFFKITRHPAWVDAFPDPMVATWLLAFAALLPAWLGRQRDAGMRLLVCAVLGPLLGALAHGLVTWFDPGGVLFQFAWVFVLSFLPPMLAMQALNAVLRRCRRGAG